MVCCYFETSRSFIYGAVAAYSAIVFMQTVHLFVTKYSSVLNGFMLKHFCAGRAFGWYLFCSQCNYAVLCSMGGGSAWYMYHVVVKKVHVRCLISWWVSCLLKPFCAIRA